MKKIEYNQNDLSHVPKSIIYWVSQGVVIDGVRYAVKEFRVEDGNFKLIIERNGEFFEVETSKESGGSAQIDPETLKGYLKTSDLGAGQGIDVRKLDSGVVVGLTDANKNIIDIISNQFVFYGQWGSYLINGKPNNESDHVPYSLHIPVGNNKGYMIEMTAKNTKGETLHDFLMKHNPYGNQCKYVKVLGDSGHQELLPELNDSNTFISGTVNLTVTTGQQITVIFDTNP